MHAASLCCLFTGRFLQGLDLEIDQTIGHGKGEIAPAIYAVDMGLEQIQECGCIKPAGDICLPRRFGFPLGRYRFGLVCGKIGQEVLRCYGYLGCLRVLRRNLGG